jgi:glycosyltransferase involved in cell wall biosynthesis
MEIVLLGPYPPPYGGISVHVQRLKERLEERGIPCVVYDYSSIRGKEDDIVAIRNKAIWFLNQLFHNTDSIIHLCGYSPSALIALSLLVAVKRKKVVVDTSGFLFSQEGITLQHRLAFQIAAKTGIYFIAESSRSRDIMLSLGIKPENVNDEIIPCFIPPRARAGNIFKLTEELQNFISSHRPLITANAFRISFYNNEDLYGIDLCIDLCANLKQTHPDIGFVFCLPTIGDYDYFNKMMRRVREKDIEDNFLFVTEPCEYHAILMRCDIFVRSTNTDGDSVSLREALYFKLPSVASDAIPRPVGTVLFKNRDADDLTSKVEHILGNYSFYKSKLETLKLEDNTEKILRVYYKLKR